MVINSNTYTQEAYASVYHRPSHQDVINHFGDSLSLEDKEVMFKEVERMQSEGSTHQEIKMYVDQTLSSFGVDLPHLSRQRSAMQRGSVHTENRRKDLIKDLGPQLGEELRNELMELIKTMKSEGSNFEEVKEVVDAKLNDYGIEHPPPPGSLICINA